MVEKPQKYSKKKNREKRVLIALIEQYLHTQRAVGSHSLKEGSCSDMSSATIRNYFVSLEQQGYVQQQHTSGGRVPCAKAYAEYAAVCLDRMHEEHIDLNLPEIDKGVVPLLQHAAESISCKLNTAVAISSPRFDHDMIIQVQFVFIDVHRVLSVITTEFGLVHTALISTPYTLTHTLLRKADRFAQSHFLQTDFDTQVLESDEREIIKKLYQESLASYFVSYSSMSQEDVWKAGFYRLLQTTVEPQEIVAGLELFENSSALRGCMRESMRVDKIRFWIGDDLAPYVTSDPSCVVIAAPYHVGSRPVGAFVIVSSMRIFYEHFFIYIQAAAKQISELLTRSLMHQRISYRMPFSHAVFPAQADQFFITPQLEQL